MNHVRHRPGSALIEVIVAISIAALIIPPIFGLIQYAGRLSANAKMRTRAVTYAKAALEAVTAEKNLRWGDLTPVNVSTCTAYVYPIISGSVWNLNPLGVGWEGLDNGLEGRLCLIQIRRNATTGVISPSGSEPVDPNIIQAISQVRWDSGGVGKEVQLITHITNWHAAP